MAVGDPVGGRADQLRWVHSADQRATGAQAERQVAGLQQAPHRRAVLDGGDDVRVHRRGRPVVDRDPLQLAPREDPVWREFVAPPRRLAEPQKDRRAADPLDHAAHCRSS